MNGNDRNETLKILDHCYLKLSFINPLNEVDLTPNSENRQTEDRTNGVRR